VGLLWFRQSVCTPTKTEQKTWLENSKAVTQGQSFYYCQLIQASVPTITFLFLYKLIPIGSYPLIKLILESKIQTPPPAPPANPILPITVNATQKEVKMNMPTPFTGDRKKLEEFLIEINMYLTMNEDTYNNDNWQIIFALSCIKDGTAESWKQLFWTQAGENNNLGNWNQFKRVLRDSFSTPDKEGDAVTKIETETMSGQTANEYIGQFKIYKAESKIMQDRQLVEWFMKGLNTPLLNRILNLKNPPTTIQGWYTTASKIDNQWRRGRAIANRLKGGNNTKRRGLHLPNHPPWYTPPTRDPYAMVIDRLSIQEQADHMKKGLCFVCHLPGHRASNHGSGGSGPPPTPRRQYVLPQTPMILTSYPAALKKADGAYAHIKTIYGNLSEEKKRKLTDSLEESGF